jgi:hypothetical protein
VGLDILIMGSLAGTIAVAAALCVIIWPVYWAVRLASGRKLPKTPSRLWLAIGILAPCLGIAWAVAIVLTTTMN